MRNTALFNKLIIIITLISVFFVGCAKDIENAETSPSTEPSAPTDPQFDIVEYKELVSDCVDELSNGSIVLLNVVNYECTYWNILNNLNSTFNSEKVYSSAMNWLEENSEYTEADIQAQYDDISSKYKKIIAISTEGNEAATIFENFDELYDAYIGLYNMSKSPSGTLGAFASSYDNYFGIVETCTAKLDTLLS